MAWIFETCQDPYGFCIRQYIFFALSILIFFLSLYSMIKTIRKQTDFSFQIIPLTINTVSTFGLVCSLSQFEQENIHIIMQVIQIYSYSLLCYSYVGLYLLGSKRISDQQFRKIKRLFICFSILVVLSIITLIILQSQGMIKCNESHGIGNLILFLLQIPLYVITFIFVIKTKSHIRELESQNKSDEHIAQQIKLLQGDDQYIKLRYQQANTVIIAFSSSILIHIATVIMFFVQKTNCSDKGYLQVDNLYELIMFSLFDLASLIPHLAIPIILYLIPASHFSAGDTVVITPRKIVKQSQFTQNMVISQYGNKERDDMLKRNTNQTRSRNND